ncbi:MAG: hypothetical protein AB7H92_17630 [Microbacteriaceae bacterium]
MSVDPDFDERLAKLRRKAGMASLHRDEVSELIAMCSTLLDERRRLRVALGSIKEHFAIVRSGLNDLTGTLR